MWITVILDAIVGSEGVVFQTISENCILTQVPSTNLMACWPLTESPLSNFLHIHPRNLTWNLKMMVSKRNHLFQGRLFRFHVKFRGCNFPSFFPRPKDFATICGGKATSGRPLQSIGSQSVGLFFFVLKKSGRRGKPLGFFNWPCWDQSDFSDVSVWYGVLDGFWVSSYQDRWLHLLSCQLVCFEKWSSS